MGTTARARALADLHTVEQINEFREQVLAASLERVAVNIVINSSARPDGRASAGVNLATAEQQEQFLADCEAALDIKASGGNTDGPRFMDFSQRFIQV